MDFKYMTVKELPESERPYERCEKYGASVLSDAELLAVIIRSGTKKERAVDLAVKILCMNDSNKGLAGLSRIDRKELEKIHGIGKIKATQILCVSELATRIGMSEREEGFKLFTPKITASYYNQRMRHLTREQSMVVFTDVKSRIIGEQLLAIGTVNASLMSTREIFLAALKHDAVFVVLLHNHPSGDPTPSKEDFNVTKRIMEAGELLGIRLMDHIILGDNRYISFKEEGYLH